jgi:hypothetical protein
METLGRLGGGLREAAELAVAERGNWELTTANGMVLDVLAVRLQPAIQYRRMLVESLVESRMAPLRMRRDCRRDAPARLFHEGGRELWRVYGQITRLGRRRDVWIPRLAPRLTFVWAPAPAEWDRRYPLGHTGNHERIDAAWRLGAGHHRSWI